MGSGNDGDGAVMSVLGGFDIEGHGDVVCVRSGFDGGVWDRCRPGLEFLERGL